MINLDITQGLFKVPITLKSVLKMAQYHVVQETSWVNFTNVFRARFLYECLFLVTFKLEKDVHRKNAREKRWWNWPLVDLLWYYFNGSQGSFVLIVDTWVFSTEFHFCKLTFLIRYVSSLTKKSSLKCNNMQIMHESVQCCEYKQLLRCIDTYFLHMTFLYCIEF